MGEYRVNGVPRSLARDGWWLSGEAEGHAAGGQGLAPVDLRQGGYRNRRLRRNLAATEAVTGSEDHP